MDAITGYVSDTKGGTPTSNKISLSLGIISLFILSAYAPIGLGLNVKTDDGFDRHLYPEYYDAYSIEEIYGYEPIEHDEVEPELRCIQSKEIESFKQLIEPLDGPIDSAWPMYCHDIRHTGLSPYNTEGNPFDEKWLFELESSSNHCAPVIDNEGVIYIGRDDTYAIYPNGTLKWRYDTGGIIETAPAIDENSILYIGSYWAMPNYLYAINTTDGSLEWKYKTSNHIDGSPVIDSEGIIYISDWEGDIHAVNPDGSQKWKYRTGDVVTSSPVIGLDGTIYCGSHDDYIYAFHPDNGTVKWKYNTGSWVHSSASIMDDGTVLIGSDNGYLYAFNPNNGTVKWKCSVGPIWGSPSIDENGDIYVGTFTMKVHKINPDGEKIWTYVAPGRIWFGASLTISNDGFIYFGTCWMDGGKGTFTALNPDGTQIYINTIGGFHTSPAIGSDGTVYACSSHLVSGQNIGVLHAFGELDPNAPSAPNIIGPSTAKEETEHEINFTSTSPLDRDIFYYVEWGDGKTTGWNGPHKSGEEITLSHTWLIPGTYTIKARAKDTDNLWGPWGEFEIEITRPRIRTSYWMQLRDMFPILREVLQRLLR